MKNRICKTLISFLLVVAVFVAGIAFPASPEYDYTVCAVVTQPSYDYDNEIFYANGLAYELRFEEAIDGVDCISAYRLYNESCWEYFTFGYNVYGSLSPSQASYGKTISSVFLWVQSGEYNNIYGASEIADLTADSGFMEMVVTLSGGEITGDVAVFENEGEKMSSYYFEVGLTQDLILSGENTVIGSSVHGITSIYSESNEAVSVVVDNDARESGDIVAYFEADDLNWFEDEEYKSLYISEVLSYFSSEYYDFEIEYFYDGEVVSNFAVVLAEKVQDQGQDDNAEYEKEEKDSEPLSKEFTVGGLTEQDDTSEESIDSEDGTGETYIFEGKYEGGEYDTEEEAQKAEQSNQAKLDGESEVENFSESTFEGTGIQTADGLELYESEVSGITENADGTYLYDGNQYESIEDAVSAVAENVKQTIFEDGRDQVALKVGDSAHYCDDPYIKEAYAEGSYQISQLSYADASWLALIYQEVQDTISVEKSIIQGVTAMGETYDLLVQSGILSDDSLSQLETAISQFEDDLLSAQTNSEVESILSSFEKFVLNLEIVKLTLADENGTVLAVISSSDGMSGSSQIILSEISDISAYQQMLISLQESGDISADNILTRLQGVSNTLEEMSVLGVMDISIDGDYNSESGTFTVKVLLPDGVEDIGTFKILHITENGIELISASVVGDYLVWETTSFSQFIIIGSEAGSLWYALIPLGIIALLLCAYVHVCRKEEKEESADGR